MINILSAVSIGLLSCGLGFLAGWLVCKYQSKGQLKADDSVKESRWVNRNIIVERKERKTYRPDRIFLIDDIDLH